jgi:hypothetical protein
MFPDPQLFSRREKRVSSLSRLGRVRRRIYSVRRTRGVSSLSLRGRVRVGERRI